ncbi:DUF1616 domain-containing protein [Halapricum salinum]|uniref:DUF1616 domain-containing protein n=1 Tax=Halapricum salinum TaxID=1457250 RepID=A0A4D6HCK3_9EURY|nr:DUF1616 domain-containing protein [Halapricum salinum]QCC51723.1 DUF1616 domain-containing protein [Halapricum salinum]
MAAGRTLWLLLPRQLRELPADLAAIAVLVVLANLSVFAPVLADTPLRIGLGFAFVLFAPGYTFVAALFPERGEPPESDDDGGIDGIERLALSFGLSIAIVPLIGLVLNFTPWGIRLGPIMVATSGVTLGFIALATVRRWDLPEAERFRVPYRSWLADARAELFEPDSSKDAALNVLLVLSILLAVTTVGYALFVPKEGEAFTELYLLSETDDGELVADDYPTNFTVGEPQPLVVGVGNHEHRSMDYTVIVELQRVEIVDNETQVLESRELDRAQASVDDGETWQEPVEVTPTMSGERLRLAFLLYESPPPGDPAFETAYRRAHLWVNVTGR